MCALRKIAFVVNRGKPGAADLAGVLAEQARKRGIEVSVHLEYPLPEAFLEGMDACCVIGGDGTLLSVVEPAAERNVPVMGINLGKLGFMATYSAEEARSSFSVFLEGNLRSSMRSLLRCESADGEVRWALNDFVVKNQSSRLVRLEVKADEHFVNEYFADGLIFSTPTGSTAYNLSSGGPLVDPDAPVFAMTPICPHTLSNRSVVFHETTRVEVVVHGNGGEVHVNRDGQLCFEDISDFPMRVSVDPERKFSLILNPDHAHFELIRDKLHWGPGKHR